MPEGRTAVQRRLGKLKDWADKNYMRLNKDKCESLYLGWNNPKQKYRLQCDCLGCCSAKNDLGILVDSGLNMSQRCAFTAIKANYVLSCISKRIANSSPVIIPNYTQDLLAYI